MIASLKPNTLLPADPLGQRICETFGRYLWNCIRAELPDDATAKPAWQTITKYEFRPRVLVERLAGWPGSDRRSLCSRDYLWAFRY
jgi:hypothetical protein